MINPRDYRPSQPRYVRAQRWRPGLKVQHLLFWVHQIARVSLPYSLASAAGPMLSARQCSLEFGDHARLSIITAGEDGSAIRCPFNGTSNYGTFEVMVIRPQRRNGDEEIIMNHQDSDKLQEIIDRLGHDHGTPKPYAKLMHPRKMPVYEIPADYYAEELHGSFLYDDRHNLLKRYRDNRVIIPPQKWHDLISTITTPFLMHESDAPVLALNLWCKNNCQGSYAWTGFGPIWTFESPADAFHFFMTWR